MMKRIPMLVLILVIALTVPLFAQGLGSSLGHDLDALWSRARKTHDLTHLDAIILLESHDIGINADRDMSTMVHRVVWIGTRAGLRAYADLRIPWNSDISELEVIRLRTWRDKRWWPAPDLLSETAIVPTLPHILGNAPDYASLRETMLLHDGIELPCIIETAYTITRKGFAINGADAVFVLPQRDPTVRVEYILRTPNEPFYQQSYNGAPDAREVGGSMLVWSLEDVPALKRPITADPGNYEPCLAWSTWKDWTAVRTHLANRIESDATLPAALEKTVAEHLEDAHSFLARAHVAIDLLADDVRHIPYDSSLWSTSRSAERIWDTAYAHDLDRAALARALFLEVGLVVDLHPLSTRAGLLKDMPATSNLDRMLLRISADPEMLSDSAIFYDPVSNQLMGSENLLRPARLNELSITERNLLLASPPILELTLHLGPDEDGNWAGQGVFSGTSVFARKTRLAGTSDEATTYLENLAGSIFEGADLENHNLEILLPTTIQAGFTFRVPVNDKDDYGRIRLEIGSPDGGIIDLLPPDIHLEQAMRESPAYLPTIMKQLVSISLDLDGYSLARQPEPILITNESGSFELRVDEEDGKLKITRELILKKDQIPAADWPQLRALLLEEIDPANREILLEEE